MVRVVAGPPLKWDRVTTGDTANLKRSHWERYAATPGTMNTLEA